MKFNQLCSVAHNIADSLASGIGLMIGVYTIEIFKEASQSAGGLITVDFLKGITTEGTASASLAQTIELYRDALPHLCKKHGFSVESFQELSASYFIDRQGESHVTITVQDKKGRRKQDNYVGLPLRRVKFLDDRGRVTSRRGRKNNETS